MKKTLLSFLVCGLFFSAQAQTFFLADFNDYDLTGWAGYDADGDSLNWRAIQIIDDEENPVGTPVLFSASWDDEPLTPDNWAITPAISLAGQTGSNTITLSWKVAGVDPDWSDENYSVYVATEDTVDALLDSPTYYTGLASEGGGEGIANMQTKTIDVTSFAGQTIYVAFRHHDSTNNFAIAIDNVMVYSGEAPVVSVENNNQIEGFSHFYNIQANTLNLSATSNFSFVSAYSVTGQEVLSQKLANKVENIDLSRLSTGVYVFNIQSQGQMTTLKIAVK